MDGQFNLVLAAALGKFARAMPDGMLPGVSSIAEL